MAVNFQSSVMGPPSFIADGGGHGYYLVVNSDGSINASGVTLTGAAILDGVTKT